MTIKWVEGAPRFIQGHYAPTSTETGANKSAYDFGALQFFWDREHQTVSFLQFIDESNIQTWANYPLDLDSLATIGFLPLIVPYNDNYVRWAVADYDPTPDEAIADKFFNGEYGLLFWNQPAGRLFKLSAYEPNIGGGYTQTWTQLI